MMFRRLASRRTLAGAVGTALLVAGFSAGGAGAGPAGHDGDGGRDTGERSWVATWAASPTGVPESQLVTLDDQTLRQVVHTSVGGGNLRIRLTNEFGQDVLHVGEVHVAVRAGTDGTDIVPRTDRLVTFGGEESADVPVGAPLVSDPVRLRVRPDSDLVISIYLPEETEVRTSHFFSFQVNAVAEGNVTDAESVTPTAEPASWYLLSGVSVAASRGSSAIVAFGDSITDGAVTQDGANHRWPDLLSDRLQDERGLDDLGVANAGIGGNRLLWDGKVVPGSPFGDFAVLFGESGLRRFDRDVLAQPGVEHVITLLGVNDIGQPDFGAPPEERVTAEDLIAGHRQLIARAHAAGLEIYGGTITPFRGFEGYDTAENQAIRDAVNEWIRTSGEYDGVVDFDAAVRDPADPTRLLAEYDSGDHLHPNDDGMAAMARAVPLRFFR
jgi:lysophospholipase L1-like esterase